MSRRIEIELTSKKDDGSWTWRAAGAKQPKGALDGALLYDGAGVGDVVRADADFDLEGINVTAVLPPKGPRKEPERLEIISKPVEAGVTSQLARKPRDDRDRKPRRDDKRRGGPGGRDGRDDRGGRGGPRGERDGADRRGPRGERPDRPRRERPERPAEPAKPKPKRLRPARTHRNEVLAGLDEKQKPVAEQVLKGGIPAVRTWVANESGGADPTAMVALAEDLLPRLRTAEWRDRAEAALKDIDELDLRDLRSVVVAAADAAKDDETRALADQVKDGLAARVEKEHHAWLDEIATTLTDGRVVRALRLSSRPPKAGAVFPPDLAERLATAAGEALGSDVAQDRWAAVLEAVALSPVHRKVTPAGIPSEPKDELLATVRQVSMQVPEIAALFGVEPAPAPRRPRPPKGGGAKKAAGRTVKAGKGARRQSPVPDSVPRKAAEPAAAKTAPAPEAKPEAPSGPVTSASAPVKAQSPEPVPEPTAVAAEDAPTPDATEAVDETEATAPEPEVAPEPSPEPAATAADEVAPEVAPEAVAPEVVAEVPEPQPEPQVADEPVADETVTDAPVAEDTTPPAAAADEDTTEPAAPADA